MIITMPRFPSEKKLRTIQTRILSGNAPNRWTTLENERMFHQSRKKIGYNISTIFIQMNLLTQRSKTFDNELRQNECHGQHSRPLDFMITEREIRKVAEKLKN